MTKIDLLPPEILEKRKTEKLLIYLISGIVFLIVVLVLIYSLFSFQEIKLNNRLVALQDENKK